jgi:CRP-like cAMP-binding protein
VNRKYDRLFRKLETFCKLGDEDKQALINAVTRERYFAPREDLIQERKHCEAVFVILAGFACRYKLLPDGRRQIVGFLLPGDLCDIRAFLVRQMDHSIGALSGVTAAVIPAEAAVSLLDRSPNLSRALWWNTLVEDSITREWVVNVGNRTAYERVAHLLCEVFRRLDAVGLTIGNQCDFPITQIELGDTVALSAVHVNRTIMDLRRANLVRLQGGQLELLDKAGLESAAGFDPAYLHLQGSSQNGALSASGRFRLPGFHQQSG